MHYVAASASVALNHVKEECRVQRLRPYGERQRVDAATHDVSMIGSYAPSLRSPDCRLAETICSGMSLVLSM